MKRLILVIILVMLTILPATSALADEYAGWDTIRPALLDGDGAEFVVDAAYPSFSEGTEFDRVLAAANWVAFHMEYVPDPSDPGDIWTSSAQQFAEITEGVQGSGTGDCEDFAILLCAMMRYSIGVPPNRVWVQGGIIAVPNIEDIEEQEPIMPPLVGHAYVVYKAERGGIFYIEPQFGGLPYRGSYPSILHWYFKRPPQTGESAMLKFNDEWVKGGGFWLAGPR